MSSLNQVELALLMKAVTNPRPKTSNAEYKRRSRAKAASLSRNGKVAFNSESMNRALIDALAHAIRSGTPDLPISDIIRIASHRFPIPVIAEASITQRLAARKPAQRHGGQDHE